MVPFTAFVVGRAFAKPAPEWYVLVMAAVMVLNLLTLSQIGVKGVAASPIPIDRETVAFWHGTEELRRLEADLRLDERESQLRDHAHFRASRVVRWFAPAWFAVLCLLRGLAPDWSAWLGPVFLSILIAVILALPQTLVAWSEPDVVPATEGEME
jgi:hypothetical protein